nr:uncharacterized protein LOC105857178 [Microcebus murinus]
MTSARIAARSWGGTRGVTERPRHRGRRAKAGRALGDSLSRTLLDIEEPAAQGGVPSPCLVVQRATQAQTSPSPGSFSRPHTHLAFPKATAPVLIRLQILAGTETLRPLLSVGLGGLPAVLPSCAALCVGPHAPRTALPSCSQHSRKQLLELQLSLLHSRGNRRPHGEVKLLPPLGWWSWRNKALPPGLAGLSHHATSHSLAEHSVQSTQHRGHAAGGKSIDPHCGHPKGNRLGDLLRSMY